MDQQNLRTPAAHTAITPAPLPMPERLVLAFDNHGSFWGANPITAIHAQIAEAYADGKPVDEWNVTDRAGHPIRIVRIPDPTFLDDILVIPTDSDPDMDEALRRARAPRTAVAA
ncbi:hypothetical protein ACFV1G_08165 [Streptomyces anulatus]|uniref:hypothetical protein n=1 Tax=Streptomyces anulatus TaxID=1892 RepID=UPI00368BA648